LSLLRPFYKIERKQKVKNNSKEMKLSILVLLVVETTSIQLRGMFQRQRNKAIETKANEYFKPIYSQIISMASTSDKYSNYSFYEYGCIPSEINNCDIHYKNIQYYTNELIKYQYLNNNFYNIFPCNSGNERDKYLVSIYNVLINNEDVKHYNIKNDEINEKIIKLFMEQFTDIVLNKTFSKCCTEYMITW
jgi:hypothetical protein